LKVPNWRDRAPKVRTTITTKNTAPINVLMPDLRLVLNLKLLNACLRGQPEEPHVPMAALRPHIYALFVLDYRESHYVARSQLLDPDEPHSRA
jgi:hypothetical protein